jgi:mannose-6-phosphate isomerase-like protein (cupin superfamily)
VNLFEPTRIHDELAHVTQHWTPRIIGQVNDQYVKVAKLLGEFLWHAHDTEDEMFLVVYGTLRIQLLNNHEVTLEPGEFFIVPRGTLHNPVAEQEVGIILIETTTTAHTGDIITEKTVPIHQQLRP